MTPKIKTVAAGRKEPLGGMAYAGICRKIISLEYSPGQVLEEKQLMADLGVGRTPVREALRRLSGEGWVELQPNKGATVPPITLQSTKAVFEAMKILVTGVAPLAAAQNNSVFLEQMASANEEVEAAVKSGDIYSLVEANHAFHMGFAGCARNEYLYRALKEVENHVKRLAYLSYSNDIEPGRSLQVHYESVVREHKEIMSLLREKNEKDLRETLLRHIQTFQQRIVSYMSS